MAVSQSGYEFFQMNNNVIYVSDDEDDTAELLAELQRLKKERAQEEARKVCKFFNLTVDIYVCTQKNNLMKFMSACIIIIMFNHHCGCAGKSDTVENNFNKSKVGCDLCVNISL